MKDLGVSSGDPVFTFDDELKVLSWNAAAEQLTGIAASDAVGRHCWELLGGQDRQGNLVCHAGCSYARIAREGRAVTSHDVVVKSVRGRRAFALSTIELERPEGRIFLHVLAGPEPLRGDEQRPRLTPRQYEVLELLAQGVAVRALAARLGIRESTARNHVRAVLSELGGHSQLEAVAKARRLGILT
jgi:PAS domain S-box-containing protein